MEVSPLNTSLLLILFAVLFMQSALLPVQASDPNRVKTENGVIEGTTNAVSGIHEFKGIPYAQPPVGDLRWKAPQPVINWSGVLQTHDFGPQGMQHPFGDMVFRSRGMSEDCLYLNVWSPKTSRKAKLPVLVYFYGGGFVSGDGSEPRYDGESMATKGIVAVTVNYRLGVFGFFAYPALSAESPNHVSGNYGLLDQNAALLWVQRNISQFGGDPKKVTIAGESAGSFSVSAQMASPLSKNLIAGAIGESGALLGRDLAPLSDGEQKGVQFAASLGANSLADLRALPGSELLDAAFKPGAIGFGPVYDGYFFPKQPRDIYAAGDQAHVPLLVGWNSQEGGPDGILGKDAPTPDNYTKDITALYKDRAPDILAQYPGATSDEVVQSATSLSSDRFIAFGTWKWFDEQCATGGKPVYRYFFSRPRPGASGAVHSAEIEYALGNLSTNTVYPWSTDDFNVSSEMQSYFANFVKKGDPNGAGLPNWAPANSGDAVQIMHIDVNSQLQPDTTRNRYVLLDQIYVAKKAAGQ
jgi:para-nitrobenzyl esterase